MSLFPSIRPVSGYRAGLTLLALLTTLAAPAAPAGAWNTPYEELRYQLNWTFVAVGRGVIQAQRTGPDTATIRIQACSNRFFDLFRRIRDTITVHAEYRGGRWVPVRHEVDQREWGYRRNLRTQFRPGTAVVTDLDTGSSESFAVAPGTLDVITGFFAARSLDLEPGGVYRLPVFDNRVAYQLELAVTGTESLATVLGPATPTLIVEPSLRSQGILKRAGRVTLWLSDDARHLPVQVESKTNLGPVRAILVEHRNAPEKAGKVCPTS